MILISLIKECKTYPSSYQVIYDSCSTTNSIQINQFLAVVGHAQMLITARQQNNTFTNLVAAKFVAQQVTLLDSILETIKRIMWSKQTV